MSVEKLGLPPLPSFVIIGAPGCATRWLRFNLDRHPEIYAPPRFGRAEPAFLFDDERLTWRGADRLPPSVSRAGAASRSSVRSSLAA